MGAKAPTVMVLTAEPEDVVYDITVVPTAIPWTTPEVEPTVAIAALAVDHTPEPGAVSVIVESTQTEERPDI
jgi:hypothetical protein